MHPHARLLLQVQVQPEQLLEGWAEDADGGKLGTLLQRYGAGPPSRALLTTLGRQADAAAQDLACYGPGRCAHGPMMFCDELEWTHLSSHSAPLIQA